MPHTLSKYDHYELDQMSLQQFLFFSYYLEFLTGSSILGFLVDCLKRTILLPIA